MRRALALGAIAVAVGGLLWLGSLQEPGAALADVTVDVVGPDGPIWNGTVHADTAYAALTTAAAAAPFDYAVRGTGSGLYVVSVDGHAEDGAEGWCYGVNGEPGIRSAALATLRAGDAVAWWYGVC